MKSLLIVCVIMIAVSGCQTAEYSRYKKIQRELKNLAQEQEYEETI